MSNILALPRSGAQFGAGLNSVTVIRWPDDQPAGGGERRLLAEYGPAEGGYRHGVAAA
jgi:hypothetical protein